MSIKIDTTKYRMYLTKYTRRAFEMIPELDKPEILDLGCGSGTPSLELLRLCNGHVTGVDIDQSSLDEFTGRLKELGMSDRVTTICKSLKDIELTDKRFDIVWCEGAIYVVGFESGLKNWKRFIKPNGFLVVHDTNTDAEKKTDYVSKSDYELIGRFDIPHSLWWKEYYEPLEEHLEELRALHADEVTKIEGYKATRSEIDAFKQSSVGSVFFVMQST